MRKPSGLVFETDLSSGKVREAETFCCKHCNKHTVLWDRKGPQGPYAWKREKPDDLGGFCVKCMSRICSRCVDFDCDPLEKKIARMIEREHNYSKIKEL